ncbi:MAG TPA: rhodanese-like domain-containing protein, partial [Gemmatimonadaceae bacterium]|nr:rhodanese-like domain-containing protein [Gemmatimonadaceae bacterium]
RVTEVTPAEALRDRKPDTVFLDVREANEWNVARIPGAVHIPLGQVGSKIEEAAARDRKIVIYCARGNRSALAADAMLKMGYTNVASMSAGIRGWMDAGGEIES